MKFQCLRVPIVGLMFVLLAPLAEAKTPEEIFVQVSPSVVVVDILNEQGESIGLGSGAVIGAGQVVTNCHVTREAKKLQVRQSGKTFKATLQYADPERDLCQLSAPGLQAPPVILGTSKKLRVGQRVYAIGAPKGLELTMSEGLISSLRDYEGSQYIQTSAAISPGSSGGGLFDDQGQLVGITSFQFIEGQNLNFALPAEWIKQLPQRHAQVSQSATDTLGWLNKAAALDAKKDWPALLRHAQAWTRKQPQNSVAWFVLGNAHANLRQHAKAIEAYRQALRIDPEDADAWSNLGITYSLNGQREEARKIYPVLRKLDPELAERYFSVVILP